MEILKKLPFISALDASLRSRSDLIQVILGPRQVGKTTTILEYLRSHLPDQHHYVSADAVFNATPEWLRQQWDTAQRQGLLLVIDEIQKCHNWAEFIKALWDDAKRHKRERRCVLLGSSSLSIQKGLTESLTGRFQLITAFHWNARESFDGYKLSFSDFLKFGGYPGSYPMIGSDEWRRYVSGSIISTVIEKDILQFHTVRSPTLFRQAFEIIIGYPAMEISYTKLLGQLQSKGNVELVKHYLALYEGAYLIKVLEKFSGSRLKTKSSSPKILPMAPCLHYLTHLDSYSTDEVGHVFEAIVGTQLVRTGEDLFYWREGRHEVDYVIRRGKQIWAIEVKSGRRRTTSGIDQFLKTYPKAKAVFVTQENYAQFEEDPMGFLES